MSLRTVIYTTSSTDWFVRDFPLIKQLLSQAKGVTVDDFDIRHIVLPHIPLMKDSDGDIKPDWTWFKTMLTDEVSGYNAVVLHISREDKKKFHITVNGSYRKDHDDIFECWISANKGQLAKHYPMSEFARLMLHELGGHGFERFCYGYDTDLTHTYDYELRQLPQLCRIMDFTEWNRLDEERQNLRSIKLSLLRKLYEKLYTIQQSMDRLILPIAYTNWTQVTQAFGVHNTRYQSDTHNGTDFRCPVGTTVDAPADGQIVRVFQNHPTMGNAIIFSFVFRGQRYYTRMLHLSEYNPVGMYKQGDLIAKTGRSGDSQGAHFHMDLWTRMPDTSLIKTKEGVMKHLLDPHAFFNKHT